MKHCKKSEPLKKGFGKPPHKSCCPHFYFHCGCCCQPIKRKCRNCKFRCECQHYQNMTNHEKWEDCDVIN